MLLHVDLFAGTCVNVICKGRPYLGAAIGIQEYIRKFMDDKVRESGLLRRSC